MIQSNYYIKDKMKLLSQNDHVELKEALSYMHVNELKLQLELLQLSSKGFNKKELVERLVHYAVTGEELPPLEIPAISKAKRGAPYFLAPQERMLYGSYKNDLATRNFFKQIIGDHFHFTAQGLDWLRERWLAGKAPTYKEFAKEWQDEYERNKQQKRAPKQEWAYIRFVQEYIKQFPEASKAEVIDAWETRRQEQVQKALSIFKKIKPTYS